MECAVLADDFAPNHLARVRALLSLGADPHARSTDGDGALAIAEHAGYGELAAILKQWIATHPRPDE
jgi:hypothetical protein